MTEFVEVKTQDLIGASLNWATYCAVYSGMQPTIRVTESETRFLFKNAEKPVTLPRTVRLTYTAAYEIECNWYPASDWDCGGPLIHRHAIELEPSDKYVEFGNQWQAHMVGEGSDLFFQHGDTPLIAACRVIVASVYGDTVSIPKELLP